MDIPAERRQVYSERLHLEHKPHLTIDETAELKMLNEKWNNLKFCGDIKNGIGGEHSG